MFRVAAVLAIISFAVCGSNKLPDYFKPCRAKDPEFDKCFKERAKEVLPILLAGDETLNLPPLSSFPVDLYSDPGKTYTFKLTGGKAEGIEGVQYKDSKFDLRKHEATGTMFVPKLVVRGNYEIDGKLLNEQVKGSGPANITFNDVSLTFTWPFGVYKKGGFDHLKMLKPDYTFAIKGVSYALGSSSKDDEARVLELNNYLTEHKYVFANDITGSLAKSFTDVITKTVTAVIVYAPVHEIFLP